MSAEIEGNGVSHSCLFGRIPLPQTSGAPRQYLPDIEHGSDGGQIYRLVNDFLCRPVHPKDLWAKLLSCN